MTGVQRPKLWSDIKKRSLILGCSTSMVLAVVCVLKANAVICLLCSYLPAACLAFVVDSLLFGKTPILASYIACTLTYFIWGLVFSSAFYLLFSSMKLFKSNKDSSGLPPADLTMPKSVASILKVATLAALFIGGVVISMDSFGAEYRTRYMSADRKFIDSHIIEATLWLEMARWGISHYFDNLPLVPAALVTCILPRKPKWSAASLCMALLFVIFAVSIFMEGWREWGIHVANGYDLGEYAFFVEVLLCIAFLTLCVVAAASEVKSMKSRFQPRLGSAPEKSQPRMPK